jgi:hypothetical protein
MLDIILDRDVEVFIYNINDLSGVGVGVVVGVGVYRKYIR